MPKITYTFYIPKESEELKEFQNAGKYHSVLYDVWNNIRSKLKYGDSDLSEDEIKAYEQVREWICNACEEQEVDIA